MGHTAVIEHPVVDSETPTVILVEITQECIQPSGVARSGHQRQVGWHNAGKLLGISRPPSGGPEADPGRPCRPIITWGIPPLSNTRLLTAKRRLSSRWKIRRNVYSQAGLRARATKVRLGGITPKNCWASPGRRAISIRSPMA